MSGSFIITSLNRHLNSFHGSSFTVMDKNRVANSNKNDLESQV